MEAALKKSSKPISDLKQDSSKENLLTVLSSLEYKTLASYKVNRPENWKISQVELIKVDPAYCLVVNSYLRDGKDYRNGTVYMQYNVTNYNVHLSGLNGGCDLLPNGDFLAIQNTKFEYPDLMNLMRLKLCCEPWRIGRRQIPIDEKWKPSYVFFPDVIPENIQKEWEEIIVKEFYTVKGVPEPLLMHQTDIGLETLLIASGLNPTGTASLFTTTKDTDGDLRYWFQLANGRLTSYNKVTLQQAEALLEEEQAILHIAMSLNGTNFETNNNQYQSSKYISFYIPEYKTAVKGIMVNNDIHIVDYSDKFTYKVCPFKGPLAAQKSIMDETNSPEQTAAICVKLS